MKFKIYDCCKKNINIFSNDSEILRKNAEMGNLLIQKVHLISI